MSILILFGIGGRTVLIRGRIIAVICTMILLVPGINLLSKETNGENDVASYQKIESYIINDLSISNTFFTENKGQWDDDLYFIGEMGSGNVGLLSNGLIYNFRGTSTAQSTTGLNVKISFIECNDINPIGLLRTHTKNNYFIGNDQSRWASNVENFEEIYYENIWDDIDLRFYYSEDGLKYDFIVNAYGVASEIRMKVEGHESIEINKNHEIEINTEFGKIIDSGLKIYYLDDSSQSIFGSFNILSEDTYGFKLEEYDSGRTIVIDPLISSTFIGNTDLDVVYSSYVDSNGDIYGAGYTASSGFPTTPGVYDTSYNGGNYDSFLFKMNNSLSNLVFSTFFGGSDVDMVYEFTLNQDGDIFLTGVTRSNDFPMTAVTIDNTHNNWNDAYLVKLNSTGANLDYSTYIGGSDNEEGNAIEVDSDGNPILVGQTFSSNFPVTSGAYDTVKSGDLDGFIMKINCTANTRVYSTFIGGTSSDTAQDVLIKENGELAICGGTKSLNFPTTSGAYDTSSNGDNDAFAMIFNITSSSIIMSSFIGGSSADYGYEIALDDQENIFITGHVFSTDFPTSPNAFDKSLGGGAGGRDGFVTKLNKTGSSIIYSTYIGGDASTDYIYALDVDSRGNAYISGLGNSNNYPVTQGAYDTTHNGAGDIIATRLSANGSSLIYSTFIGSSSDENGLTINVNGVGEAIITGNSRSTNFPTTAGSYDTSYGGGSDGVIIKILMANPPNPPLNLSGKLGDGYCNLSWEEPSFDGGVDIQGYNIFRGLNPGQETYLTTVTDKKFFNDTAITNGIEYYYNITAINRAGESGSSEEFEAIDMINPVLTSDHSDTNGSTGDPFSFNVTAGDNVAVSSVHVECWNNDGFHTNISLETHDNDTWNHTLLLPADSINPVQYNISAVDPSGNWANSSISSIPVLDNDLPIIVRDLTFQQAYTGDSFTPDVEVTDNVKVENVTLFFAYGDSSYYHPLKLENDFRWWNKTIIIDDDPGPLKYYFVAIDSSGNSVTSSEKLVDIIDNDKPTLGLDRSDVGGTTGDTFNFDIEVFDNVGITEVIANYWDGLDLNSRTFLTEEDNNRFIGSGIIAPDSTYLKYYFIGFDNYTNRVSSFVKNVTITDNDPPILIDSSTEEIARSGLEYTFAFRVMDNIEVKEVWIEYWYGDSEKINVSAENINDLTWEKTISIPGNVVGQLNYRIHMIDSVLNRNMSDIFHSDIVDVFLPAIIVDNTQDRTTTGEQFVFNVEVADNHLVGSVHVGYRFGDDELQNISMDGDGTYTATITVPLNRIDDLYYSFHFSDASGNWDEISVQVVDVIDNDPPQLEREGRKQKANTGDDFLLELTIKDNIAIRNVSVDYWVDEEEINQIDFTLKDDLKFNGTIPISVNSVASYNYVINAYDNAGNSFRSELREIIVVDNISPTVQPIDGITIKTGGLVDVSVLAEDNIEVDDYEWEGAPIPPNDNRLFGKIDNQGEYLIKVTVSDEAGNSEIVEFTIVVEKSDDSDESSFGLVILIIIILLILIAVIGFFVYRRKQKDEEKDKTEGDNNDSLIDSYTSSQKTEKLPPQAQLPGTNMMGDRVGSKPKMKSEKGGRVATPLQTKTPSSQPSPIQYKSVEHMPRAPEPVTKESYISPKSERENSPPKPARKESVKGELGPKHTNMLNPKKK